MLTIGAKKYEIDNWKYVPNGDIRYKNAALRHLNSYLKGEHKDPETGENHLAHAICCLMFMLDADESGQQLADENGEVNLDVKFDVPKTNYIFNHTNVHMHGMRGKLDNDGSVALSGTARPTDFFKEAFK